MMRAHLHRWADSPFGVFGWMRLIDDRGVTVELFAIAEDDWLDNKPTVSAIPAGLYLCKRVVSPRFGPTFEVTKVPGRSKILFHNGNTEEDTLGCLLLGERFGALTVVDEDDASHHKIEKWCVKESNVAFRRFRDATVGLQEFALTVEWAPPGSWRDLVP
jgi:hypothetical protein